MFRNTRLKVARRFPRIFLIALLKNLFIHNITGHKKRYTIFIIKKKTRHREIININKFRTKLSVKLGNKFLNVHVDRENDFRTNKYYFDEKHLYSDCRDGRRRREDLVQLVTHAIFNNLNGIFVLREILF